jgi:hypothetical protein
MQRRRLDAFEADETATYVKEEKREAALRPYGEGMGPVVEAAARDACISVSLDRNGRSSGHSGWCELNGERRGGMCHLDRTWTFLLLKSFL